MPLITPAVLDELHARLNKEFPSTRIHHVNGPTDVNPESFLDISFLGWTQTIQIDSPNRLNIIADTVEELRDMLPVIAVVCEELIKAGGMG